jgi:hypothetical protein
MDNVIQLNPSINASQTLRNIADRMDSGEIEASECTVIAGTDIFHCGAINDARAAESDVFNMTFGIHKLMKMCNTAED